jgi:hypothetical protein
MLILAVVLTGAIAVFALFPLLERQPNHPTRSGPRGTARQNQTLETLWIEKMRVLRSIRDLDFDYDLDKLTDTAYQTQRMALLRLAAAITVRIDALEAEIAEQEARLEEAVAAFRHSAPRGNGSKAARQKALKRERVND